MDGRLLALARAKLAKRKAENEAEAERRRRVVYERLPEYAALDARLRSLVPEAVGLALRRGTDVQQAVDAIAQESLALQDRQRELLRRSGFSPDYLDERHDCPKCGDTGYVNAEICDCLLALYEAERASSLSQLIRLGDESFENFDLTLYSASEPDPQVGETPRVWMGMVLDYCRRYADAFGKDSPNLLFSGGTGLGKTYTSACIARVVAQKGVSVVYESVSGALEPFEQVKFGRVDPEDAVWGERDRILNCELLILDDLGTEMQTAFSRSALYTILNQRLIENKKTIVSTNLSRTELREHYGPQLASRFEGEYITLRFIGSDIRLLRKNRKDRNHA